MGKDKYIIDEDTSDGHTLDAPLDEHTTDQAIEPSSGDFGKLIDVNVKFSVKAKIGGEWFNIKKGHQQVPESIKEVLLERGALEAT